MLVIWVPYILAELKMTGVVKALGYPEKRQLPAWGERLNVHNATTATCAMGFFWARVLHPIAQVTRIWGGRTVTFAAGATATLIMLSTVLTNHG